MKFYGTAGAVLVLDQITKIIARGCLRPDQSCTVIPGLFDLKLGYNSGAAFGILPNWAPLFIVAALVTIYATVRLRRAGGSSPSFAVGLGLLLGGALGNLIDRLANPEIGVTDFLSFHIDVRGATHAWPAFNIADAAIVVGALALFYHVFILDRQQQPTDNSSG